MTTKKKPALSMNTMTMVAEPKENEKDRDEEYLVPV